MTKKTIITCENLAKHFGDQVAVDDVDLEIPEGEFFALLGPSGCGKTTLLRMIAGLEIPSSGRILLDGKDMTEVPPNKRPVNMVFQSYAVFPHMSVADNVGYGLKVEGVAAPERQRRVEEALKLVQLEGYGARQPHQLSGGQRQRVALARALVKRPRVLLLDEPLSALDAKLREQMRSELAVLQYQIGVTFVFVTHDQDEALAMADRCAVMNNGKIVQIGTPTELYEKPSSRFVADFIGSVNMFDARFRTADGDAIIADCAELGTVRIENGRSSPPDAFGIAIRPEKMALARRSASDPPPSPENTTAGMIEHIVYLGSESVYEVKLDNGTRVKVLLHNRGRDGGKFDYDELVWVSWPATAPVILTA
jgi:spermidine/putrescine ABC transporter ATP-binding subunit